MKVYTHYPTGGHLEEVRALAQRAEALGYDGITFAENKHDPFVLGAFIAAHTQRVAIGTVVAIAFSRSPMSIAHTARTLQQLSHGRFELGLGTSLKPLNEQQYSVPWSHPAARMREYIQSLRAIWDCWQNGTQLNYQGEHYSFSLMTANFNPGPSEYPSIPVYIAAMGPMMCRLVGECCDGILTHSFTTRRYMHETVLPRIDAGVKLSGRARKDLAIAAGSWICTGATEEEVQQAREEVRRTMTQYAVVRTYKGVMDLHGWGETCLRLRELMLKRQWDKMPALITDEMLDTFSVSGTYDTIGPKFKERFGDYATRIPISLPSNPKHDDRLGALVEKLHKYA